MSRRWSVDPDVEDELRALLAVGHSPARALERLAARPEYRERLPSLRTAQRMAHEVRPARNGAAWSFADAPPDEARLVLPVLASVGDALSLSAETAAWIVRVRTAVPTMDPREAFLWALRYQAATAAGRDTMRLDRRLASDATAVPTRRS